MPACRQTGFFRLLEVAKDFNATSNNLKQHQVTLSNLNKLGGEKCGILFKKAAL